MKAAVELYTPLLQSEIPGKEWTMRLQTAGCMRHDIAVLFPFPLSFPLMEKEQAENRRAD